MIYEHQVDNEDGFWIDHFHPRGKGGLVNAYENLYWSCIACDRIKSNSWPASDERRLGYRFADPCREQDYGVHFLEKDWGKLEARTPCGEYHLLRLRLNRPTCVKRRIQRNELRKRLQEAADSAQHCKQILASEGEQTALGTILWLLESIQNDLDLCIPHIPLFTGDRDANG